jgi:5-methylcytosine-specific restriction endonuclease McrBC regulatory subunit McrC
VSLSKSRNWSFGRDNSSFKLEVVSLFRFEYQVHSASRKQIQKAYRSKREHTFFAKGLMILTLTVAKPLALPSQAVSQTNLAATAALWDWLSD